MVIMYHSPAILSIAGQAKSCKFFDNNSNDYAIFAYNAVYVVFLGFLAQFGFRIA